MPSGEMDDIYTIGVNNRFRGIDNDDETDPFELIRAAQEKPKKEKEVKPKGKKDLKPVKGTKEKTVKIESPTENESTEGRKTDRNNRGRGRGRGGRGRGGDQRGRGGRGGRGGFASSPTDNTGDFNDNNNNNGFGGYGGFGRKEQSPTTETRTEGFGGGFGGNENEDDRRGGRSGFRGRGRGRGRSGRGGREFDRCSGSDKSSVKAFDKRDGSGSYNWGTPQDELAASEEPSSGFGAPGKENEDVPAETTETIQETDETQEKQEDTGPVEMTLEEYKKQQSETRSAPQFNIRKVEGEKKGMKQLKKPTEEESEADGSLYFPKKFVVEKPKFSGRVKEHLNLGFQYGSGDNRHLDTTRRGRGPRGGRSNRGGRKDESAGSPSGEIALENAEEFPSLL